MVMRNLPCKHCRTAPIYDEVDPATQPRKTLRLVPRVGEACGVCQKTVASKEFEVPAHFATFYEANIAQQ